MESIEDLLTSWSIPANVIEFVKAKGLNLFSLRHASDDLLKTIFPDNDFESLVRVITLRRSWVDKQTNEPDNHPSTASSVPDKSGGLLNTLPLLSSCGERNKVPNIIMEEDSDDSVDQDQPKKRGMEDDSDDSLGQAWPNKKQIASKKTDGLTGATASYPTSDKHKLKTLLSKSDKGRKILQHQATHGNLNKKRRDHLCQIVVDNEKKEDSKKKICFDRFNLLADEILDLFPKESKEVWVYKSVYNKGGKKMVKLCGKLYNRYYNTNRRSENVGSNDIQDESNCSADNDEEIDDLNTNPDILFLKNNNSQLMDKVVTAWKNTAAVRLGGLKSRKAGGTQDYKCTTYMSQYPALLEKCGLNLLTMDFEYLYPGKTMEMYSNWQKFSSFISSKVRETNPDFLKDAVYTTNEENLQVLLNVSKIFSPIAIARKDKQKKLDEWKSTRLSSQDGFLMHIQSISLLHERLEERALKLNRYGLPAQPIAAVIGPTERPTQYVVVLDNYHYEVESPIQAVDSAFKIYQALNAKYPPEAEHLWMFVQRAVYGITIKGERKFGVVETLTSEYSKYEF